MQVDNSGNPIGPPIAGFVQAGNVISQYDLANIPNVSKRILNSVDPNNLAPRVGFVYSPRDSLVLRGGYGIYYSRPSTAYIGTAINAPPLYTVRRSPSGGTVPFADPFFPLPSQDQFPALVSGVSLTGQIFDRSLRTAYFHQYNAGAQYLLRKDLLIEVSYVGTRGLNLIRDIAINQAQLASPQHPIVNAVTRQAITTNTPANATLRAPYQGVEVGSFLQIQSTAQSGPKQSGLTHHEGLLQGGLPGQVAAHRVFRLVDEDLRRHAQPGSRIAIDDQSRFESLVLQIRVGIANLRQGLDRIQHDVGPFLEFRDSVALDRILELGIAAAPADTNVLRRLQE